MSRGRIAELRESIVAEIRRREDRRHYLANKVSHKGYDAAGYGLTAPVLAEILRRHRKEIRSLDCGGAMELAMSLGRARSEEQVLAGNYVLENHLECLSAAKLGVLDRYSRFLVSWSTTDDFAIDVVQPVLMKWPDEVLRLLRKWNASKHMWQRRASVVAFTRKAGASGRFTGAALELCENLVNSDQDLIRKAVGWTLKDVMRGDRRRVLEYVRDLRRRGVSAVITLYALRDVKGKQRERVLRASR